MKTVMSAQKKYSLSVLALLFLIVVATSCSIEDGNPIPEEFFVPPSVSEFNNLRTFALWQQTETALFNAEDGFSFTSNDGAVINIPSNCLKLNGDLVNGEVELTFIDIYHRKDMLPTNKPVMGYLPNGDKAALITGGEFFVEVRKDGTLLDAGCMFQLRVPGDLTGGTDHDMILWNGIIDDDGNLTWEEFDPNDPGALYVEEEEYFVFRDQFGWTNIDKFYSDTRPKTTMKVKVPQGFNNLNSAVYLSYDGEPNALAQLDTFDSQTKIFSEHYGQIPIGLEVHLIFATADGDNWRYAIKGVTISENETYVFNLEETQVNTFENMVSAINALP